MSVEKSVQLRWLCRLALMGVLLMLAGCVSGPEYTAGGPVVQVRPSKGWWKTGVSGKEAWETWQNCKTGNQRDTEACMEAKGFSYGKLTEDQVYVPPPPPRKGWVKPGMSRADSKKTWDTCYDVSKNTSTSSSGGLSARINQCMADRGFVFRELKGEELPSCLDTGGFPPCRDEPKPHP